MIESVKAVVRIKPDSSNQEKSCYKYDEKSVMTKTNEKYQFEYVFDEEATN
jgi:hypothetical protein